MSKELLSVPGSLSAGPSDSSEIPISSQHNLTKKVSACDPNALLMRFAGKPPKEKVRAINPFTLEFNMKLGTA